MSGTARNLFPAKLVKFRSLLAVSGHAYRVVIGLCLFFAFPTLLESQNDSPMPSVLHGNHALGPIRGDIGVPRRGSCVGESATLEEIVRGNLAPGTCRDPGPPPGASELPGNVARRSAAGP